MSQSRSVSTSLAAVAAGPTGFKTSTATTSTTSSTTHLRRGLAFGAGADRCPVSVPVRRSAQVAHQKPHYYHHLQKHHHHHNKATAQQPDGSLGKFLSTKTFFVPGAGGGDCGSGDMLALPAPRKSSSSPIARSAANPFTFQLRRASPEVAAGDSPSAKQSRLEMTRSTSTPALSHADRSSLRLSLETTNLAQLPAEVSTMDSGIGPSPCRCDTCASAVVSGSSTASSGVVCGGGGGGGAPGTATSSVSSPCTTSAPSGSADDKTSTAKQSSTCRSTYVIQVQ